LTEDAATAGPRNVYVTARAPPVVVQGGPSSAAADGEEGPGGRLTTRLRRPVEPSGTGEPDRGGGGEYDSSAGEDDRVTRGRDDGGAGGGRDLTCGGKHYITRGRDDEGAVGRGDFAGSGDLEGSGKNDVMRGRTDGDGVGRDLFVAGEDDQDASVCPRRPPTSAVLTPSTTAPLTLRTARTTSVTASPQSSLDFKYSETKV